MNKPVNRQFRTSVIVVTVVVVIVLIASVLSTIAWKPCGVSQDENGIIVHLNIKDIVIPAEEIDSIVPYPAKSHTIRLCGIGTRSVKVGLFQNEQIGKFDCYVTDFKKAYVIYRKNDRPVVISVDNPEIWKEYYKN